jgi:hypothetical protein
MDNRNGVYPEETAQCARERSAQILRDVARRLHAKAVQFDSLADWASSLTNEQDEALWQLVTQIRV